jgi:hypothetical protein
MERFPLSYVPAAAQGIPTEQAFTPRKVWVRMENDDSPAPVEIENPAEPSGRTFGEVASDAGYQLAKGAVNIAGTPFQLFAPEGETAQQFNQVAKDLDSKQSETTQQLMRIAQARIDQAAKTGVWDEFTTAAKEYASEPALFQKFVMENVASMIPGLGAAKGAQMAGKGMALARGATPLAAAATGVAAGTVAGGATNSMLNAGGARQDAFEDWKKTLMAQGMGEAEATQIAVEKSRAAAAVGGVAGAVSGGTGLERAILGGMQRAGARGFAVGAAKELGGELLEELSPKAATNIQIQPVDPSRPWTHQLGQTAAQTLIASSPGSVLAGVGGYRGSGNAAPPGPADPIDAVPSDGGPIGPVAPGPIEGDFIPSEPMDPRRGMSYAPQQGATYDQNQPTLPPGQPLLTGPQPMEGDVLGPESLPAGQALLDKPAIEGSATVQGGEFARPMLPAPEDGGPSERQVSTAIGLLKHSPKASPDLLQRLMRVDQTMATMLFNHWKTNGQVAGNQATEIPAAGDQGQGADIAGSRVMDGFSDGAVSFTPGAAAEDAALGGEPGMAMGATGPDAVTPLDVQAHAAATSPFNAAPQPTEAQKQAGNYKVGRIKFQGMDISIENPAGSVRSGTNADGKAWENTLVSHYGYIRGTTAKDGDHVDAFIKPGAQTARTAYVIDQIDPKTGKYDEAKVILGADSEADAQAIYHANYKQGWQGMGAITAMPIEQFKDWIKSGKTKKPVAYVEPKGVSHEKPVPKAKAPAAIDPRAPYGKVGVAPFSSQVVGLQDNGDGTATVMRGEEPFYDFENGDPVTVPAGATAGQIRQAVTDAGALSNRDKWFGVAKPEAKPDETGTTPALSGTEQAKPEAIAGKPVSAMPPEQLQKIASGKSKTFGTAAVEKARDELQRRAGEFIKAPDGSTNFGEITQAMADAMGRQGGKIKLRNGNDAEGLRHIELRHGKDVRALGYADAVEFVADVAQRFDAIYRGDGRAWVLATLDKPTGKMNVVLELEAVEGEGDFYDVKNATPTRSDQFKNKKPVWEKEKPLVASTGPSGAPDESGSLNPRDSSGSSNIAQPTAKDNVTKEPWQYGELEFGDKYIDEVVLPQLRKELENAHGGRFQEYPSKAAAVRGLKERIDTLENHRDAKARKYYASLDNHYGAVRAALADGKQVPPVAYESYEDLKGDVSAGRIKGDGQEVARVEQPQHIEAGQAEPATKPVIAASIKESAKNTPMNIEQAREWLLSEIDKAIIDAKSAKEEGIWNRADDKVNLEGIMDVGATIGFKTFNVPGDGKFRVLNLKESLQKFKKQVAATPGFKKNATRPMSLANGSGGKTSVRDMLDEGEYVLAADYGHLTGKPLLFGAVRKGEAHPIAYTDAEPVDIKGIEAQVGREWNVTGKSLSWRVIETTTGMSVSSESTKEKAISKALAHVDEHGTDNLIAQIKETPKVSQAELERQFTDWGSEEEAKAQKTRDAVERADTEDRALWNSIWPLEDGEKRSPNPWNDINSVQVVVLAKDAAKAGKGDEFVSLIERRRGGTNNMLALAARKALAEGSKPGKQSGGVDYKGFERTPTGNGNFTLKDGNLLVKVEAMGGGKFQASHGSAKSSPHINSEQGAVDWAANLRDASKKTTAYPFYSNNKLFNAEGTAELPKDWTGVARSDSGKRFFYLGQENGERSFNPLKAENYEDALKEAEGLKNDNPVIPEGYREVARSYFGGTVEKPIYAPFAEGERVRFIGGHAGKIQSFIGGPVTTGAIIKYDNGLTGRAEWRDVEVVRVYLDVPFRSKDAAKGWGAKFDPEKKLWYADRNSDGGINVSLTQYVPQPDAVVRNKPTIEAAALNKSAETGEQYAAVKHPTIDGGWMVGKVGAGDTPAQGKETAASLPSEDVKVKEVGADTTAPKGNTEDSGAELTYNRRNRITRGLKWDDIADKNVALRVKEVTKAKVFPKPDYQALVDDGTNPLVAHLVKQVYDSIATVPSMGRRQVATDADMKLYIEAVNRVMDGVQSWATDRAAVAKWAMRQANGAAAAMGKPTSLSDLESVQTLLDTVYPGGWKNYRQEVILLGGNKLLGALQPGYDEVQRATKDIAKGWPGKRESWQQQGYKVLQADDEVVRVRPTNVDGGYFIEVAGKYQTRFPDKASADQAASDLDPWLLLDRRGQIVSGHPSEAAATEAARVAVERKGKAGEIHEKGRAVADAERTGPARRMEGEDISSDRLKDDFGFRGINFGEWMKGDSPSKVAERQLHLNHAYDAFLDLAEILNVPPKAMSLNGMLGLAIGAQGGGKALAHFVPGVNEINLTRTGGAGALAHEWGHALDHYFGTLAGLEREKRPYLTEHASVTRREAVVVDGRTKLQEVALKPDLRSEILDRFKAIVATMTKRAETATEAKQRLEANAKRYADHVESWLRYIRKEFSGATKPGANDMDAVRTGALETFDNLAARIGNLDLGEGMVAISRDSAIVPVVAEMRDAFKAAFGRFPDVDSIKALQANIDGLRAVRDRLAAEGEHEPQQIATDYQKASNAADEGKKKPYWGSKVEMFARAFDAFVVDTLADNAAKNSYLAGIEAVPPMGSERKEIGAAFRDLIAEIQTKETDTGVAMFNAKSGSRGNPLDAAALEATIGGITSASPSHFGRETVVWHPLFADLPSPILEKAKAEGYDEHGRHPNGYKIPGITYDGKVYLVQENISSELEAEETLLHERIHQIVHGNAKDPDGIALRQSLGRLYLRLGAKSGIERLAKEAGIDITGPLAALPNVSAVNRHAFLAEEFLAHAEGQRAYEKLPAKIKRAIREFYGEFRDWLRGSRFVRIAEAMGAKLGDFTQADLAWTLKGVRQQEAGTGSKAIRFMTAYHGTPHEVDRFSTEHIGTGEGAQAYGWGLYFAGRKEVAEWYRKKLASDELWSSRFTRDGETLVGREALREYFKPGRRINGYAGIDEVIAFNEGENFNWSVKVKSVEDQFGKTPNSWDAKPRMHATEPKASEIDKVLAQDGWKRHAGRVYTVELAPKEDEYLDWDKPLSEQSDTVKAAIDKLAANLFNSNKTPGSINDQALEVIEREGDQDGADLYQELEAIYASDQYVSELLHSIGIRGIRYRDGTSRSRDAGEAQHNYVIFDDADVTVTGQESRSEVMSRETAEKIIAASRGGIHTGETVRSIRAGLHQSIGKAVIDRLEQKGLLRILKTADDLPYGLTLSETGTAMYDGKVAYLIADRMQPETAIREVLHEIGEHHGLEGMLGKEGYATLVRRVRAMEKFGNKRVREAFATVRDRYPEYAEGSNDFMHEVLANIGQDADIKAKPWWQKMLAEVKRWIVQLGYGGLIKADDIQDMVLHSLKVAAGKNQIEDARGMVPAMASKVGAGDTAGRGMESRRTVSGDSGRTYTAAQQATFANVGRQVETPSLKERVAGLWDNLGKKMAQGIADQFAPLKDLDKGAYLLARMSKGADGALEAMLMYGKVFLRDGVYDVDAKDGGVIDKLLQPLGKEADDFMWWVAGNRADTLANESAADRAEGARLLNQATVLETQAKQIEADAKDVLQQAGNFPKGMLGNQRAQRANAQRAEDMLREAKRVRRAAAEARDKGNSLKNVSRENLMTPGDIQALKDLAKGTMDFDYTLPNGKTTRDRATAYAAAQKIFSEFNKSVMDIAEESGLIDGEARSLWERDFYVPFYREMEGDKPNFPNVKSGLVRQRAFHQLKGGTEKLNSDLLANTILNWSHLLHASAKNRAAVAAVEAAGNAGIAEKVSAADKGTVTIRENGKEHHYLIDDPFIFDAITAMEFAGFGGPAMKVMGAFKRWLTIGVTASPTFKVRNLIRDSISAIGTAELSYNLAKNLKEGLKATSRDSQTYASMLASGGHIRFGTMIEGNRAGHVRRLVEKGIDPDTILDDPSKLKRVWNRHIMPAIDAWNEIGDRSENINRAAIYEQLRAKGIGHAEASLAARDLLDFSMGGTWAAVRFLTAVVPFANARIQGLYKLGRAGKDDPKRLGYVVGAVALASLALLAAYRDDDDWKKREDWDRDTYWWFKVGGVAYRIPKPFEIGSIGTLAERTAELLFDKEMGGERFGKRLGNMVLNTFAMNPVPQMFKPVVDLYANKDSFTGRTIESMGMEKLRPEDRYTARSSEFAKLVGKANVLSPVQVDHLVRGYLGWLGTAATTSVDSIVRLGESNPRPAHELRDMFLIGSFVETLPTGSSRYVTQMYEQSKEIEEAYNSWRKYQKIGDTKKADEIYKSSRDDIDKYRRFQRAQRTMTQLNAESRRVEADKSLSSEKKRNMLREIATQKDRAARMVAQ